MSMVNENHLSLNHENWTEENASVLKIAALHNNVERIFVNFVIKKSLCENYKGERWLNKIRPWWGHVYHYHVRLACPDGNKFCSKQKPIQENDGCDETLAWWFSDEAKLTANNVKPEKSEVRLPSQCQSVYEF